MDAPPVGRARRDAPLPAVAAPSCASPWSLVDDVVPAVDIEGLARYQPRRVERQEGRGRADVFDADHRARAWFYLCLGETLVELGNTRSWVQPEQPACGVMRPLAPRD